VPSHVLTQEATNCVKNNHYFCFNIKFKTLYWPMLKNNENLSLWGTIFKWLNWVSSRLQVIGLNWNSSEPSNQSEPVQFIKSIPHTVARASACNLLPNQRLFCPAFCGRSALVSQSSRAGNNPSAPRGDICQFWQMTGRVCAPSASECSRECVLRPTSAFSIVYVSG